MQLIDASSFWTPMPRSLGDKRRQIPSGKAKDIVRMLRDFRDGESRLVDRDGK